MIKIITVAFLITFILWSCWLQKDENINTNTWLLNSSEKSTKKTNIESNTNPYKFVFSYKQCENPWSDNIIYDINTPYWENDILIIKPTINSNCWIEDFKSKIEIKNKKIILNIDEVFWESAAMCDCNFDTEFRITGIIKDDYEIILNKNNKIVSSKNILKD